MGASGLILAPKEIKNKPFLQETGLINLKLEESVDLLMVPLVWKELLSHH